jgi:hypothetical protein
MKVSMFDQVFRDRKTMSNVSYLYHMNRRINLSIDQTREVFSIEISMKLPYQQGQYLISVHYRWYNLII